MWRPPLSYPTCHFSPESRWEGSRCFQLLIKQSHPPACQQSHPASSSAESFLHSRGSRVHPGSLSLSKEERDPLWAELTRGQGQNPPPTPAEVTPPGVAQDHSKPGASMGKPTVSQLIGQGHTPGDLAPPECSVCTAQPCLRAIAWLEEASLPHLPQFCFSTVLAEAWSREKDLEVQGTPRESWEVIQRKEGIQE